MASPVEIAAMRRAIELASLGDATTRPNPNVGAVVLDTDGLVVGEGWHERPGRPHAEIIALATAGPRARGGTVVVTLEPCNHVGRTGACAGALVAAGVARVVYAVSDPWPPAAGGAATLLAAGVDVEGGVLAAAAEPGNARWLTSVRWQRPYVVWKYAATLDGRVAAADGTSRWVTGPAAREDVHRLRATMDVIAVGVGTVLADDPWLTVRDPNGALCRRQPLRLVVDTEGRTPPDARVRDRAAPTWVATGDEVGRGPDGRVDLGRMLQALHRRGHQALLLEGGPRLAAGFVAAGLVDRVIGYVAPALLGDGPPALDVAGIRTMSAAIRLQLEDVGQIGPDVRLTARVLRRPGDQPPSDELTHAAALPAAVDKGA